MFNPYKNIEEAINIANDTSYGLSSMVSCGDPKRTTDCKAN